MEQMKEEILSFVDNFIENLPYFLPGEVILECTECEKALYGSNRESKHLECLKPHDFEPIAPQTEKATYEVTCVHCQSVMMPYINYLHEGHKKTL